MNDNQDSSPQNVTPNWIGALFSSMVHDLSRTVGNISNGLRLLEYGIERDAPSSPQKQLTLIRNMQGDLRLLQRMVDSLAALRHMDPVACDFVEDVLEPAISIRQSKLRRILIEPNARTMPQVYVTPALAKRFITELLQELDRFAPVRIRATLDEGRIRFCFETTVAIQETFMSDAAVTFAQAANMVFSLAPGSLGACLELSTQPKVSS